jgi:hypothetical protein
MKHRLQIVVEALAKDLKITDPIDKRRFIENTLGIMKSRYSLYCSCCGRRLSIAESMKLGFGPKCASGKCECLCRRIKR